MKVSPATIASLVIIAIMTVVTSNLNWGGDHWKSIVESDAKGYYAYLPAVFLYQDLNYAFFEDVEVPNTDGHFIYDYRVTIDGHITNKYYCGTAIAQLPFFLLAHGYCMLTDNAANGYSKPYAIAVSVAALFYLFVGLFFIGKTLDIYRLGPAAIVSTLFAVVFGTNLFYYTVCEPGMSHIYSFGFVAAFVYFSSKFFRNKNTKTLVLLGVFLGLIVLIRPVNALIVAALPFLAGSWVSFNTAFRKVLQDRSYSIVAILGFLMVISIQLIIHKVSVGSFFAYTYAEEGFNFLQPHVIDILFSYKKGLFLYTPLYLFMVLAAIWVWQKNRFKLVSFLGFFIVLTYILSSWWNWWYGGSFSSRVYVEYLPLLAIPLAVFLGGLQTPIKQAIAYVTIFLTVAMCQIQTYQYRYYLIHWEDMTKEKYWDNFLKLKKNETTTLNGQLPHSS